MQDRRIPGVVLDPEGTFDLLHYADLTQVEQVVGELATHFVGLTL